MHKENSRFMDSSLTRIIMLGKGYLNTTRQSHTYAKRAGLNGRQGCVRKVRRPRRILGLWLPIRPQGEQLGYEAGSKDPVGLEVLKTNLERQNSLHRSQLSVKSC